MAMGYQGKDRANDIQVRYVVKTSGDRWFIPYNNNKTTATQVADCNTLCGVTTDDSDCGSELVAS
tara:strand:+ start:382 stop:576 length:195 start_codon:yes stop_codon:yes gene_type:complete